MNTVLLETDRLRLRGLSFADADAIWTYRNDPEVARYQGWPLPYTLQDAVRLVADMAGRSPGDPGWVQIGVERQDRAGLIGDVALNTAGQQAELGVTLAGSAQGQGYAREALRALIGHAFGPLGLLSLTAEIDPRNAAVTRLLTRLGFRHAETQVGTYLHRGEWTDNAVYTLTPDLWKAVTS